MATTKVKLGAATSAKKPTPADAEWIWLTTSNLINIHKWGEWAVKEGNRIHGSNLSFDDVEQCWVIPWLNTDIGLIYLALY